MDSSSAKQFAKLYALPIRPAPAPNINAIISFYDPFSSQLLLITIFRPLPSAMAAVHTKVGPRHKTWSITDQECSSTSILLRLAKTTHHILSRPISSALRELHKQSFNHSSDDVARRDGIDTNAVLAPFGGEVACQLQDGGFGGVVGGANESLYLLSVLASSKGEWKMSCNSPY